MTANGTSTRVPTALNRILGGVPSCDKVPIQAVQLLHVSCIEIKTINIQVGLLTLCIVGFWQRDEAMLKTPSDEHLRIRDPMLACYLRNRPVVQDFFVALPER